jgi:hypothetical protein
MKQNYSDPERWIVASKCGPHVVERNAANVVRTFGQGFPHPLEVGCGTA